MGVKSTVAMAMAPRFTGMAPGLTTRFVRDAMHHAVTGVGPLTGAAEGADKQLKEQRGDVERAVHEVIEFHVRLAGAGGFVTNLGGMVSAAVTIPVNITELALIQCRRCRRPPALDQRQAGDVRGDGDGRRDEAADVGDEALAPAYRTWFSITSWTARSTSPCCSRAACRRPRGPGSGPTPWMARLQRLVHEAARSGRGELGDPRGQRLAERRSMPMRSVILREVRCPSRPGRPGLRWLPCPSSRPPGPWVFPDRGALAGRTTTSSAMGADLEPGTLLAAYRAGLFPMPRRPADATCCGGRRWSAACCRSTGCG